MNTIGNNKLIAEFMELEKTKMFFNLKTGNYVKNETDDCEVNATDVFIKNGKPINNLFFHSDWNWLMEVVEKIKNLVDNKQQLYIDITFGIFNCSLPMTYNACVEFIKWYNQQSK